MSDHNSVTMIGRLTRDPELRCTQTGKTVCQFGIANNRVWKDQSGQNQEDVGFFDIVCWGYTANNCGKYLKKGSQVHISGRLSQRRWQDHDGNKRSKIEITATDVQFLGGRQQQEAIAGGYQRSRPPENIQPPASVTAGMKNQAPSWDTPAEMPPFS